MNRIFVSYSMNDQPYATEALRKYFAQVDERVEIEDPMFVAPSHDIREAIRERIEASDSFVTV